MNGTQKITIICWAVAAILLVVLAVWIILRGQVSGWWKGIRFDNPTQPYALAGSYEAESGGITNISVQWTAGEVVMSAYDGDTIVVNEYARRTLEDGEKLSMEQKNGTLEIEYTKAALISYGMFSKKLEIFIPRPLAAELGRLELKGTSAALKASGLGVDEFSVHTTSGECELSDLKADEAEFISTSGAIHVARVTANELKINVVSGEVKLSEVEVGSLISNSTSGMQDFSGRFENMEVKSVSGEINIADSINPVKLVCGTTSGAIEAAIPGGSDLAVSYATTSGKFTSEIPVTNAGDSAPYRFSSVSGSIKLKKLPS